MAGKTPEDMLKQAEIFNTLGQGNNWERSINRYTEDLQTERGATSAIIPEVVNKSVRDSQNKNPGIERTAIVMKEEALSDYEKAIQKNMNTAGNKDTQNLQKFKTRNAESKAFMGDPSWAFGENPTEKDKYKREVNASLQSDLIISKDTGLKIGAFIDQVYTDETQDRVKLVNIQKERGIISDLDKFSSNSDSASTPFTNPSSINPTKNTIVSDSSTFGKVRKSTEVDEVVAKLGYSKEVVDEVIQMDIWKPEYNPLVTTDKYAIRAGSGFGFRIHPVTKKVKMHTGLDCWARGLLPIVAVASGWVEKVVFPKETSKCTDKSGHPCISYVVINHGRLPEKYLPESGRYQADPTTGRVEEIGAGSIRDRTGKNYKIKSTYMHNIMIEKGIKRGKIVKAGDVIAYTGGLKNTPGSGGTTGYHLHFEISITNDEDKGISGYRSGYIDPLTFEYPKVVKISDEKAKEIITSVRKRWPNYKLK